MAHLGDPVLASALATTYGLTRDSILNSLQFYHIIDGLPPDIMHDILEGALQYEVKEMLQVFIEENYFSLDALHKIFQEFKYGYTDVKNKATTIHLFSLDHKLGLEGKLVYVICPNFQHMYL